jgi:hypothetical protein
MFFGHWDVYSGPMHVELVLHDDGTYGEAVLGGAQTHWGQWEIEPQQGAVFLALRPIGSMPPGLLSLYGSAEPVERHMVLNVLPNQIQFYDAWMTRRFVPAAIPVQAANQAPAGSFPPPAGTVPAMPNAYFRMPIAPPSPLYSAPAPGPASAGQSTPIMNQWKTLDAGTTQQISDIYAQINADDLKTSTDIRSQNAGQYANEFKANADIIAAREKASHDFAQKFSNTLNPRRF